MRLRVWLGLIVACLVGAAVQAHPATPTAAAGSPSFWAGPVLSGSWYQPSRNGEGFILEVLPDGTAVAAWFTFPSADESAEQVWLVAPAGRVQGNRIVFPQVYRPRGGVFGDAFDSTRIESVVWGSLELEFSDCHSGVARYVGEGAYASGTRELRRITSIAELDCGGRRRLLDNGARALAGLRDHSGNWFVQGRAGEGWFIEDLVDGRALVYWFTFDPQGRQAWIVGVGRYEGDTLVIAQANLARGARFGAAFDPAQVQVVPWGRLEFSFQSCTSAAFRYESVLPGYGSGTRLASRVTALASAPCIEGVPAPRINGSWVELASTPGPAQSEHAATTVNGQIYTLGGFGDPRGFKRYDPAQNGWSELPDLPGGRHHLAAFAYDGGLYMVGGDFLGGGDQTSAAFRFDIAAARWDPVSALSPTFGSQAAVLNGRVYVGATDGSLEEFDPRQNLARRIAAPGPTERDHAQVQAFLGEIWVLGGRFPDTNTVAIYDPVSERWRAGPSFIAPRGGFAAAVVDDQLLIGGGEAFPPGGVRVVPTVEVYTAGDSSWRTGPALRVPVHGVAGVGLDGRFYVISGSTQGGRTIGATGRVFAWSPQP